MRKKLFVTLLLCLTLCLSMGLSAHASAVGYISDAAGLLSADELAVLSENAKAISEHYDCGVYLVIVDDYRDYVNGSIADFSEAVYKSYALGMGSGSDGILLAMSMEERDYDLCAYGDWANYAFTDYGKDKLAEEFLDNFRNNDWAGGFNDYVAGCSSLMEMAKNGEPLDIIVYDDVPDTPGLDAFELLVILVVSSAAGFAVCGAFAAQLKTVRRQSYADHYGYSSSTRLTLRSDKFLRRDVVRTRINRDNDGPSRPGGGRPQGTTVNAGGFSHKSGKF